MYGRFGSRANQPCKLPSLQHEERHKAPGDRGNAAQQGFTRLSQADAATGIRQTPGTPAYPPYHEDP